MSDQEKYEQLLIDYCLNRLDAGEAEAVRARLRSDKALADMHLNVARTLDAVGMLPEREPPEDLVARTMAKIGQSRQLDSLIAREELGRGVFRPTFSLREAAAMVAAVLIVTSLFVPSVRQIRRGEQRDRCASNIGQIGTALGHYANENDGRLPVADGSGRRWLPGNSGVSSNSSALFRLVANQNRYAPTTIFICPGSDCGQTFQTGKSMVDFPNAGTIQYSYQHSLGRNGLRTNDPRLSGVAGTMVILGDATPLYRNGAFDARQAATAVSDNHAQAGQNVLYLDMHVSWVKVPTAGVFQANNKDNKRDNIYVAGKKTDSYEGNETPIDLTDTFLLPAYSANK